MGLRVAVHQLGPSLLCPKQACQAMGLGRAGTARTKIRIAQAASIAYNIVVPRRRGEIHALNSSLGPRSRGGMMPRNDTWRGRDAHQGLAEEGRERPRKPSRGTGNHEAGHQALRPVRLEHSRGGGAVLAIKAGIVAMVKAASGGALQSGGVGRRGKV